MRAGKLAREMFFPSDLRCIVCGDDLPVKSAYGVCDRCKLSYNTKYCLRCGRAMKNMADYCDTCQNTAVPFDLARAPFVYEKDVIALVHRLKFGSAKYLAPFMAQFMTDTFMQSGFDADLVTFVPVSLKRRLRRGYDQAEELARALAVNIGVPLATTLARVADTRELAKMGRRDRAAAIQGAFSVTDPALIKGKNIVLVDDVLTSGATSGECTRTLKAAKCGKVFVLTFASARTRVELY